MAQETVIDAIHIEGDLHDLWLEIDGLPETVGVWPGYDEEAKLDFYAEWTNLMGGFRQLARADAAGAMTDDQYQRYAQLVRRYEEVLPLIQQLGLSTIPVPKLTTRHR